jgi:hypothetical protein
MGYMRDSSGTLETALIVLDRELEDDLEELRR